MRQEIYKKELINICLIFDKNNGIDNLLSNLTSEKRIGYTCKKNKIGQEEIIIEVKHNKN